jgi:hypothetical protein
MSSVLRSHHSNVLATERNVSFYIYIFAIDAGYVVMFSKLSVTIFRFSGPKDARVVMMRIVFVVIEISGTSLAP